MEKKKPKRIALSKKIRFEVFKRDSFTCQYCGESAPDVILHCDHIIPVKEGGTNSVLNLVTACINCNLGKGSRQLSDNIIVKKTKKQADEISNKIEQIQMLADWQKGLSVITEKQIDLIEQVFFQDMEMAFTKNDRITIKKLLKRFDFDELLKATEISREKYVRYSEYDSKYHGVDNAISKIGGICWNRKKRREDGQEIH